MTSNNWCTCTHHKAAHSDFPSVTTCYARGCKCDGFSPAIFVVCDDCGNLKEIQAAMQRRWQEVNR